jgi:hypothetical protein
MDDELPFASHIVRRGRTYQYVRRVPADLIDAFPFSRVQRSLRTPGGAVAYEAGARVHSEVERQFAAARRKKGTTLNVIPVGDSQLADWFGAALLEADWRERLRNVPRPRRARYSCPNAVPGCLSLTPSSSPIRALSVTTRSPPSRY